MLCVDFNPIPNIHHKCKKLNKFLSYFTTHQIGRWYKEREYIHNIIRQKVKERGIEEFFLPENARGVVPAAQLRKSTYDAQAPPPV